MTSICFFQRGVEREPSGDSNASVQTAVDPLDKLAEFCRDQDLWSHIDAAYGVPAARTKAAGNLFQGLDRADSLVINQRFLDDLNARLLDALERDGRVFLSGTTSKGKKALRACSVNHRLRREDVDSLLEVIRDVGAPIVETAQAR